MTQPERPTAAESYEALQARIDQNIIDLINAGQWFSPAGLVVGSKTTVSRDDLLGRHGNEGPTERELTVAVAGEIVVADGEDFAPVAGAWPTVQAWRDSVSADLWRDPVLPTQEAKQFAETDLRPYLDIIKADVAELRRRAGVPDEPELCAMAPYQES